MSDNAGRSSAMVSSLLSIMMFLEFFVWGAWYVTMGPFMDSKGIADSIPWAYSLAPIAAIVSPFFLGLIADRFFASEKVLGVMHLAGGAALMLAPWAAGISANAFLGMVLLHTLCFMPTLGLTNTVAFHNITNSEKQFPLIRVFGTIGWIAAGLTISFAGWDTNASMFYLAGGCGLGLGVFSFLLPHTPPPAKGKAFRAADALGLDAVRLLKDRSFFVFSLCSFLICIPLAAYYAYTATYAGQSGIEKIALNMSFGQMSEVVFMLIMPLFFVRLGVKWMLLVGMAAWVLRYGLFAASVSDQVYWMILGGILLHGICYDFFFVTGQIYVDKAAGAKIRGAAQGFLVLITQGLGMLIGAQVMGRLVKANTPGILFDANGDAITDAPELPSGSEIAFVDGQNTVVVNGVPVDGLDLSPELLGSGAFIRDTIDWQTVWTYPAAFAAVIMVIFFVFFKNSKAAVSDESAAGSSDAVPEIDASDIG